MPDPVPLSSAPISEQNTGAIGCLLLLVIAPVFLLCCIVLFALVIGFLTDIEHSLPNDYEVVYFNASNAIIESPERETVVRSHVRDWDDDGRFVWGTCLPGDEPYGPNRTAWFILDTSTGRVFYFTDSVDRDRALRDLMNSPSEQNP